MRSEGGDLIFRSVMFAGNVIANAQFDGAAGINCS